MLIFLIPRKSARVAVSWDRVSRLLSRTIASACRQTCGDFRVLVACHDIPAGDFSQPAVEFIPVEVGAEAQALGCDAVRDHIDTDVMAARR